MASITSEELLAHFDAYHSPRTATPSRGVLWVLKWAVAVAALAYATCTSMRFAYCVAAEHTLLHAARAGAQEATLPQSSTSAVTQTVRRRLARSSLSPDLASIVVRQNGNPISRKMPFRESSVVSVTISISEEACLPIWLRRVTMPSAGARVHATAERRIPGRTLPTPTAKL